MGFKIVRGAYIEEERKLADEKNYPDPVNENFEKTTLMYYNVTNQILDYCEKTSKSIVEFGTHNSDGILYILKQFATETKI